MAAETAARLTVGEVMSNFTYDTPFATGLTLSDTVQKTPKTALLFLRYYGCTLCQYDIHQLAENYHQITDVGGQVIVVLQSDPAGLAQELQPDTFPFSILCDPKAALYERFGIQPAASMAKMADAGTMLKIAKATAAGYKHGAYEGNELQLCGGQGAEDSLRTLRQERRRHPRCPHPGQPPQMTFLLFYQHNL